MKRLPPYAGQVPADCPTLYIGAGPNAWHMARQWHREGEPGLILPPGEKPGDFTWPVKGRNVALLAVDLDQQTLLDLITELAAAGPCVLVVYQLFGRREATDILH